jgi:hypothetical protein
MRPQTWAHPSRFAARSSVFSACCTQGFEPGVH